MADLGTKFIPTPPQVLVFNIPTSGRPLLVLGLGRGMERSLWKVFLKVLGRSKSSSGFSHNILMVKPELTFHPTQYLFIYLPQNEKP